MGMNLFMGNKWDILSATLSGLSNKLLQLEDKINQHINDLPIGEVYIKEISEFVKFTRKDISDQIDNKFKIKNIWFDKSDILMYDDIYIDRREFIKSRYFDKGDK